MKEKFTWNNGMKMVISVIGGLLVTIAALILGLDNAYSGKQEYYDIVAREVAQYNMNKTGELHAVWLALVLGVAVAVVIEFLLGKIHDASVETDKEDDILSIVIGFLVIPNILLFVFNSSINYTLLILLVVSVILLAVKKYIISKYFTDREAVLKILIMGVMVYFAESAVGTMLKVTVDIQNVVRQEYICIALLAIVTAVTAISLKLKKIAIIEKTTLLAQLFLPLILCTGMVTTYRYNEATMNLKMPGRYMLIMFGIIVVLQMGALYGALKRNRNVGRLETEFLILPTTIMIIVAFRMLPEAGYVYSSDFWHTGEELLPWQQIIDCGLTPYKEYNSESGLYPMFFGFIHNILLDGKVLSYNFSWFLQYLFAGLLIGAVVYKFAGGKAALLFAVFVGAYDYNRTLLLIPSVIILCILAEKEDHIRWLLGWITICFLNGLFYPIYGAALLVGTMPYGIYQAYLICKEKELKKQVNIYKIVYAIVLGIMIVLSIPMLLRMALNVLELSAQTQLGDGITAIYPISIPEGFMPFLSSYARSLAYVVYEFATPILVLMIFWALLYIYITKSKVSLNDKLKSPAFILLLTGAVTLPITYSFGFVRMDTGWFLARTSVVLIIFTGMVLPVFLLKYGKDYIGKTARTLVMGTCMFITFYMIGIPLGNEINETRASYDVSDEYVYIENSEFDNMGTGYIKDLSNYILTTTNRVMQEVLQDDEKIFLLSGNQAMYYLLEQGSYTKDAAIYTMADGTTQNRNIEDLEKNPPILVQFDTLSLKEYYIYYWLMENEYVFYDKGGVSFFVDKERYNKVFGSAESARMAMISDYSIERFTSRNMEGTCTAWGNSMETLKGIFSCYMTGDVNSMTIEKNYCAMTFENGIRGFDADFIYLELELPEYAENEVLRIYWSSEEQGYNAETYFEMNIQDGKVLIPMGAAPSWLLTNNTGIKFEVIGVSPYDIRVKSVELLKLLCDRFE